MRNLRGWAVRVALLVIGIVVGLLVFVFEARHTSAVTRPLALDAAPASDAPAHESEGPSNEIGETPQLD